jgi:hypothetical protein
MVLKVKILPLNSHAMKFVFVFEAMPFWARKFWFGFDFRHLTSTF